MEDFLLQSVYAEFSDKKFSLNVLQPSVLSFVRIIEIDEMLARCGASTVLTVSILNLLSTE